MPKKLNSENKKKKVSNLSNSSDNIKNNGVEVDLTPSKSIQKASSSNNNSSMHEMETNKVNSPSQSRFIANFVANWDGGWGEIRKYDLWMAVKKNDLKRVNELIRNKRIEVDFKNKNEGNKNVLHLACQLGHKEIVCYLLSLSCRTNLLEHIDDCGKKALDYALENQSESHVQIVKFLESPDSEETASFLLNAFTF